MVFPRITDGGAHGPDMAVEVDTPEEAVSLVDDLVCQGIDFIKPYEMLRPEVFTALVQRAQHHHLPACGHLPIRMTIPEVLEVGQYDIQHLGGICAGIKYDCSINSQRLAVDRVAILDGCTHGESGVDLLIKILNSTEMDTRRTGSRSNRRLNPIICRERYLAYANFDNCCRPSRSGVD